MNCVLRCVCEDDSEVYIAAKRISEFEIITEEGSKDNDPIVEAVVINPFINPFSGYEYYCETIEIFYNGISVGEMNFNSNEVWRKSEVLKMLMECFKKC